MTGGKRLRIAALFVIVLVFAFIMDMSSNAITDNTLIRNDTGDGDAVYDLVLNADGLDEDYSYQLKVREEQPSEKQANELFTQAKKEIDDSFCEENQSVEQVRGHVIMKDAYASGAVEAEWTLSDYDVVDINGDVNQDAFEEADDEQGKLISASVELSCGEHRQLYDFSFVVFPDELDAGERLIKGINRHIDSEMSKTGGRASDKDNLKIVIAEILALRSAANMAYLAGSASKQAQAMALAAIIGGITLTPEVIEGVEKGILAAWAFCESVLDLRALLDGDKIPLIKSDTSWTSSLYGMTSMLTGQVKAKSSNEGIGYKSYLGMLLFTKSMKNIAYRSMDVQEATVRMTGAHESFRMDNAICELSADVSYKYHGIFLCFVNLLDGADNEYTIKNKAKYSYYGR